MPKKFTYFMFFIGAFFLIENVSALSMNMYLLDCGPLSDKVVEFLSQIYSVFKYVAPVLALVLIIKDFAHAAASQDKDELMKATRTAIKRIILVMVLFFIPILVNFFTGILGWNGTCSIS